MTATPTSEPDWGHVQIKCKCMKCGLHFVVCTEFPEQHSSKTLYCPECGQHGDGAAWLIWTEPKPELIFQVVPGQAQLVSMTLPKNLGA